MVAIDLPDIVNLIAFSGLTAATYTIFYLGGLISPKRVSINMFSLAVGINLIGISHLFRMWLDQDTSPVITTTVAVGSTFTVIGIVWVFYENVIRTSNLKRRAAEIKAVISNLKDKYYRQEISEKELENTYSGLLKELAEIEVELGQAKSKKGRK